MPTTRILLARHGETEWNRLGRWQGHADPPLNELGRRQAETLAAQLSGDGISAVYASDLRRASETAAIVAAHLRLEVREDRALREIDVGSWSGLTRDEVRERFPDGFARWQAGEIGHDGETREQLETRVVAAVESIAHQHPAQAVLVVTHGGAIRALRRHAAGHPGEALANGAAFALALVEGVLVVDDNWRSTV